MTGNKRAPVIPALLNFYISAWYIKGLIAKGKVIKYLFIMGFFVSGVVFLIIFSLGTLFFLLMNK